MSVKQSLGKVSITPKGAWSTSTAYVFLDSVSNNGSSYLAKQDVPAGTSLSNTDYWLQIAAKGDPGTTSWDGITDKPATFPPSAHNHDGRYYTKTETDAKLLEKVDKVTGKGLSTNDFDNTEKAKVDSALQPADVKDNLTSTDTNKPLSAKQGKVLKEELNSLSESITNLRQTKQDNIELYRDADGDLCEI